MTNWLTRPAIDKTFAHSVPFFEDKMAAIKVYKLISGNTAKQNGFVSANASTKIAEELKKVIYKMKSEQDGLSKG